MTSEQRLLFEAIRTVIEARDKTPAAREMYSRWRSGACLDKLDPGCFQMLPMLGSQLGEWTQEDRDQPLLMGIWKRAWSRNQICFQRMAEALELLRAAGIAKTVVSGPAAIAVALQEKSIVRPIGWFDILMPREAVGAAVSALNVAGWRLENEAGLRRGAVPDFLEGVFLKRGDADRMRLCWRLHLGPEGKERWPGVVRSHHRGMALDCPGVEDQLAQAAGSHDRDGVPWECDAFLITRGEEVQWPEVARKLRWDPEGLRRLQTLPDYAVNEHERGPGTLKLHYQMLWRDYCLAEWSRGIAVSAGPWRNRKGLIRFLGERWGTPVWQLPFQGLRRILRHSL